MNKPEPLKNKIYIWDEEKDDWVRDKQPRIYRTLPEQNVIEARDIKLAVEWLKKEIEDNPDWNDSADVQYLKGLIDEAFADVRD